jgi:hypothetical protein
LNGTIKVGKNGEKETEILDLKFNKSFSDAEIMAHKRKCIGVINVTNYE